MMPTAIDDHNLTLEEVQRFVPGEILTLPHRDDYYMFLYYKKIDASYTIFLFSLNREYKGSVWTRYSGFQPVAH